MKTGSNVVFAFFACATLSCRAEIAPVSPVGGETVAIIPEAQRKVMSLPTLADRIRLFKDDETGDKSLRHDKTWRKAAPLLLKWRTTAGEKGPWKIEIGKSPDLADARTFYISAAMADEATGRTEAGGEDVPLARNVSCELKTANLETGREYHWRVTSRGRCAKWNCNSRCKCEEHKRVTRSDVESFRTEEAAPRWIRIEGNVRNIRDLGGWTAEGGRRVRQGMAYRGQGLNDNSVTGETQGPNRLTVEDLKYLTGTLGVRTDLDLRSTGETADLETSPLGQSVALVFVPLRSYDHIFKPEGKKFMAEAFRLFCDRKNYPIYFHCIGGADRTGSLAYVLNGILGVCRHDLEVDWESTFYPKIPDAGYQDDWCREAHFNEGFSKYGAEGDSWNRRIELYLLDCGVTESEIAAFRAIMLE